MARKISLLGDSHFAFGFSRNSTVTSFVADASGIVTVTTTGNHNVVPGNYVFLQAVTGDATFANVLNGACVRALPGVVGINTNNIFRVSATFNGQTLPPGQYSGLGWEVYTLAINSDSSWFNWIQYLTGNPFQLVGMNAYVGATTDSISRMVPKLLAGPYCDAVMVTAGANDLGGVIAAVTDCLDPMYQAVYKIRKSILEPLIKAGKYVYYCPPPPSDAPVTSLTTRNATKALLRRAVLEMAEEYADYMEIIDVYGLLVGSAGAGATGAIFSSDGTHTTSLGNVAVGKGVITQLAKIKPAYKYPVNINEDNATLTQVTTAWVASTSYPTLPTTRQNGGRIYILLTPGISGPTGPLSTANSIQDGTCFWAYVTESSQNLLAHGLMDAAAGTNNSGTLTGTVPTGWRINATTAGITGTSAAAQTRSAVSNTNGANLGSGWNLSLVFAANNDTVPCQALANLGALLLPNKWYQVGLTLTAQNTWVNMKSVGLSLSFGGQTSTANSGAATQGNSATTLPLVNLDTLDLRSPAFFIGDGAISSATLTLTFIAAGAGTCNLQVSNAFLVAVPDPYEVGNALEQRQSLDFNPPASIYPIP